MRIFAGLALANCCRPQLLPPELSALMQLPVLRWLSRPVMCRVAVTLPVAARRALPPRLSAALGLYRSANFHRSANLRRLPTLVVPACAGPPLRPCLASGRPITDRPCVGLAFSWRPCDRHPEDLLRFPFHLTQFQVRPRGLSCCCAPLAVST